MENVASHNIKTFLITLADEMEKAIHRRRVKEMRCKSHSDSRGYTELNNWI